MLLNPNYPPQLLNPLGCPVTSNLLERRKKLEARE